MSGDEEERGFVETALAAVDAGDAGHWPTVAGYLADEVRRLRARPEPATGVTEQAVEAAAATKYAGHEDNEAFKQRLRYYMRPALEAAQPYMGVRPVVDREAIEAALRRAREEYGWAIQNGAIPVMAGCVLALLNGEGSETEGVCGKPGPHHHGPCVFSPGHHDGFHNGGEWTPHADRGGWTWNDQPAADEPGSETTRAVVQSENK